MSPAMPGWTYVVADWMPLFVLAALILTAAVTWLLCGECARRLAAVVARQDRTIRDLEIQLAEAEALLERLTGGADDIIRAARGAHHRSMTHEVGDRVAITVDSPPHPAGALGTIANTHPGGDYGVVLDDDVDELPASFTADELTPAGEEIARG
ncbi:hypothetical protein [Nocardiopsis salina]|uniref:hypothetical protein n=1 Tax=Nocardiopsis salina TaxID=245836 RepID=UPI000346084D|nr:hypothetical protein [Nocardiopsis salina]